MAEGDFSTFEGGMRSARTFGMRALMDCASGVGSARWERVREEREGSVLRALSDFPYPDVCDAWGVSDLGDEFRVQSRFARPVQFIIGSLDGLTPIANIDEIRASFPLSGLLVVENMGHEGPGIWFDAPEVMVQLGSFMEGGPPLDGTVAAPPVDWVLPRGR